MPQGLRGRVVLVTGAARGIGLATATAAHEAGAAVVLADIDADLATHAAERLGSRALGCELDVTDEDSFLRLLQTVETRLGPLDVLVNNAGIMPIGPFLAEPVPLARRTLDVNVAGALIGMKTVLPGMMERGHGHVVNVASVAGRSPVPGGLTYAATKAAVVSMTESARVEFANTGVEFTCVLPSFTDTELIAGTKGTRFVPTVQPGDVATAMVAAFEEPTPDIFVPRVLGPVLKVQSLLGRSLRDRTHGLLGADRVFLDVDADARRAYSERIQPPVERRAHADAPACDGHRPRSERQVSTG